MKKSGFTLVELSIVLVIIGLLIGGILVAQSMIQTAKIQSQIRQFQQYDIATTNFKNKFNAIPGDCFTLCSHISDDPNIGIYDTGSRDNKFQDYGGNIPPTVAYVEAYYFFRDLSFMGIIPDYYTCSGTGPVPLIGTGAPYPKGAIRGGLVVTGNAAGDIYYAFMDKNYNALDSSFTTILAGGNFSAAEALAVDTKLDDSNPATGKVAATGSSASSGNAELPFVADTPGATACTASNGAYNVSVSGNNVCRITVKSDFTK